MARKSSLLLCCLLTLSLLSGCWSRRELNELGISVAVGIDKAKNGYRVTAQVVNPGEVASAKATGNRTPITVYEATGPTVFEALRKMTTSNPREIYLAHLRVLVIGEALAKEGIEKPLDHFSRDQEVRTDYFVVIAHGTTAKDVLKVLTPVETIPANNLYLTVDTSQKLWAPTATITLDELISDIISEGKNPVLTAIRVTGKGTGQSKENVEKTVPPTRLKYSGLAVFRKDKLVGWLNTQESKGYNYITDNVQNTVGSISCPEGGKIAVEVMRSKTKLKGHFINGKPHIDIKIELEENIGEVECQIDLTQPNIIDELELLAEKRVNNIIKKAIKKTQTDLKVDVFGFGEAIRRADPAKWKMIKKDWTELYTQLEVTVTSDVKIRRIGTVTNSFHRNKGD